MWPFNRDKKRKPESQRSSAVPLSGRNTNDSSSPHFYPIYTGNSDSGSSSSYDSGSSCDSGSSGGDSGGSCGGGGD